MPDTMPCMVRFSGWLSLNTANLMLEEPALRTRIWLFMTEFPEKFFFFNDLRDLNCAVSGALRQAVMCQGLEKRRFSPSYTVKVRVTVSGIMLF